MDGSDVNAVAVKLPTFWPTQPRVWFTQAEAQFHIRKITDDQTKFYHVVAALDQATASRLVDVLSSPPNENKYDYLKQRLISTFGLTRRERASRLLHFSSMGDKKPSELMDEILLLLDGHIPCLLAEQVFLEQLPEDVRLQIADSDFSDPRALALRADTLCLAKQQSNAHLIHRVSAPSPHPDWCYYHTRFGKDSKKCRAPCAYQGNARAGRQ